MKLASSGTLPVYKGKAFVRFARKARITDADLWHAAQRANHGLIDADLVEGSSSSVLLEKEKESPEVRGR